MAEGSRNKRKNVAVEEDRGKTTDIIEQRKESAKNVNEIKETGQGVDEVEREKLRELLYMKDDEKQLDFILSAGHVQECNLSLPYRTQLSSDKWNLFLRPGFEDNNLSGYLRDFEDVRAAIAVNVFDKGGHEFEMMLKKWVIGRDSFFVLNRGWFNFCSQHYLGEDDVIAIRTFRHKISRKLSFVVTYKKMK